MTIWPVLRDIAALWGALLATVLAFSRRPKVSLEIDPKNNGNITLNILNRSEYPITIRRLIYAIPKHLVLSPASFSSEDEYAQLDLTGILPRQIEAGANAEFVILRVPEHLFGLIEWYSNAGFALLPVPLALFCPGWRMRRLRERPARGPRS